VISGGPDRSVRVGGNRRPSEHRADVGLRPGPVHEPPWSDHGRVRPLSRDRHAAFRTFSSRTLSRSVGLVGGNYGSGRLTLDRKTLGLGSRPQGVVTPMLLVNCGAVPHGQRVWGHAPANKSGPAEASPACSVREWSGIPARSSNLVVGRSLSSRLAGRVQGFGPSGLKVMRLQ
jgi:hypothetical protein